jgi:hypothetical protein
MSGMFVGAMCAVGTLNVNAFGFPALNAKIAVFFLAAMWLAINHIDSRARDYPLVRTKYALLLLLAPLLAASAWIELQYFLGLKADVITSCCGSLFSEGSPTLAAEASSLAPVPAMWLFYGSLGAAIALAAWHGIGGGRSRIAGYALAAASALAFVATIAGILSFVSLYIYEHPHHHCPFCILKPEYGYQGYWLYLPLFVGSAAGLAAGAVQPFARIDSPARSRAGLLAQSCRHRRERLRLNRPYRFGDDLAIPSDTAGALMRFAVLVLSFVLLAACGSDKPPARLNIGDIAPTFPDLPCRRHACALSRGLDRQTAGDPLLGRLVQVLRRRNEGYRCGLPAPQAARVGGHRDQCRAGQEDRGRIHAEARRQLPGIDGRKLGDCQTLRRGRPAHHLFRRRQGAGASQAGRRGRCRHLRTDGAGSAQVSETIDPKAPCDLCSLPVGPKPFSLALPEKKLAFCCEGCKGIYQMLHQIKETGDP